MTQRPPIWKLLAEGITHLGGKATYSELKEFIRERHGEVNDSTVTCEIISCSVNHPSRIHYTTNKKPRVAESHYDFLFNVGRGKVESYDQAVHGVWEITNDEYGKLVVCQKDLAKEPGGEDPDAVDPLSFPLESHLRDFIVQNLQDVRPGGTKLHLYEDPHGRDGCEYPTDVGPIDILACDAKNNFVIFELKLSKGPDAAVGQVLRYMGWVKKHLANGAEVSGVIVAAEITDKLKYAVSIVPSVTVFAYAVGFKLLETKL